MKKLENEVLLSRRAALGAFATVALGTAGLLAGCGSDKATVTEDAGDGDKKEEAKKEEQSTTDLAVGATGDHGCRSFRRCRFRPARPHKL